MDGGAEVVPHNACKFLLDALAAGEHYDLIICDLIMKELNGLAFLGALGTLRHAPPVIIMSGISTDAPLQQLRALGAKGFIHKSADPDELREVILTVREGGEWFPDHASTEPGEDEAAQSDSEICATLTKRHAEILRLLAGGAGNREIGETLFISENTVKSHLKQMFANFGVTRRTALVQRARLLGLI